MKKLILVALFLSLPAAAGDTRQPAKLTPSAQEVLRREMLDNLIALNEILALGAENRLKEAGGFAAASASGNRGRVLPLLPNLTANRVACRASYRTC